MARHRRKEDISDWWHALERAGCKPKGDPQNSFQAICPAHKDTNPSLSISRGSSVPVVVFCFGANCPHQKIRDALGVFLPGGTGPAKVRQEPKTKPKDLSKKGRRYAKLPSGRMNLGGRIHEVIDTYVYRNRAGQKIGAVVRFVRLDDDEKTFRQYTYELDDDEGYWFAGGFDNPKPVYGLLELLEHPEADVWIVEGEKATKVLRDLIHETTWETKPVVITWAGGASGWAKTDWSVIEGRTARILADEDKPGRLAANGIGSHLKNLAKDIRVVEWPGETHEGPDDKAERDGVEWLRTYVNTKADAPNVTLTRLPGSADTEGRKWRKVFIREKHKQSAMIAMAMENEGVKLRFNERAGCREISQNGGKWVDTHGGRALDYLRMVIQENYGVKAKVGTKVARELKFTTQEWSMFMNAIDHKNSVDDFKLWLDELPEWDKTPRLDSVLDVLFKPNKIYETHGHTLQSSFAKWASRFLYLAPIQQTYLCESFLAEDQIDARPLFVGPPGIGKSKMLRCLLPEDKPKWFTSSFHISNNLKAMVEVILGCVIVEASELAGLKRADLELWKSFSSTKADRVRLPWRPDAETIPRRCIIIGTTNDMRCIPNDRAGWRRDVPIILDSAYRAVEPFLMTNRMQLWAEALHQFKLGARAAMNRTDKMLAVQWAENFRRKIDPIEDAVAGIPLLTGKHTTIDLIVKAGMADDKKEAIRLPPATTHYFVDMLQAHGWEPCEDFSPLTSKKVRAWKLGENFKAIREQNQKEVVEPDIPF